MHLLPENPDVKTREAAQWRGEKGSVFYMYYRVRARVATHPTCKHAETPGSIPEGRATVCVVILVSAGSEKHLI